MARGFRGDEDAQVIDGQVTARQDAAQPLPQQIYQQVGTQGQVYTVDFSQPYTQEPAQQYDPSGSGFDATGLVDAGVGLATNPKSKTLALLVKLPFFAYVTLSDRMPPLVRLAALALGVMEGLDALDRQNEIQTLVDQGF